MPEHPDVVQIKTELDIRRARIKKQFQEKIRKLESSLQGHREKIEVYKKKGDSDIARIEQTFDRKTAVTIKRLLGEEKYGRLQQWLLEKKENELHRLKKNFNQLKKRTTTDRFRDLKRWIPRDLPGFTFLIIKEGLKRNSKKISE